VLARFLWYCLQLSRDQWLRPAELEKLQIRRLKALLKHAYEKVPLYHEKFDSAGVKPNDINSLEDVRKIPFTTKAEIRSGIPDRSIAKGYDLKDCVKMPTSGTTGGPMPVYYDRRFFDYYSAAYYRLRQAMGFNPWDRMSQINFTGEMPAPPETRETTSAAKPASRWISSLGPLYSVFKGLQRTTYITYNADDIISEIVWFKPKLLSGNPSYLRLITETIVDRGITDFHPLLLRSSGEVLDQPTREYLETSLRCDVFETYGANEARPMAWECKKHQGLHISADLFILEVIQDGEPVGPLEKGDIVVTSLLSHAMPVIRYRTGDIGVLDDHLCSCGRGLPLLRSVEGRAMDCFTLLDGTKVTSRAIMTTIQGTRGVSRYQAVQENETQVRIELMKKASDPEVSVHELKRKCHELLGHNVEIDVTVGTRKDLRAKFKPVISKLTVSADTRWINPREAQKPLEVDDGA
jgi:phenylacetate-CoA ligase